jgi:hypothetical protein
MTETLFITRTGTEFMVFTIFSPKNYCKLLQNFDHNIGFWENAIFSPKIDKNYDQSIDSWQITNKE